MRVSKHSAIGIALASVAVLVGVALVFFEWNWLRGPLAAYLSARFGREVAIGGDLRVQLSSRPLVSADDVTLANVKQSSEPVMIHAQRVTVRVAPMSLLSGPVVLPELALAGPRVLLERDADGHGNWEFAETTAVPRVDRLAIEDGVVRYVHSAAATDVTLSVASSAASASAEMPVDGEGTPVHFSGKGMLRQQPFAVEGDAASLLALEQGNRPYRLNARIRAGDTRARFEGTVVPNRVDNVDGRLTLQGRDLSQLYPIVPVPFPWTPPYRMSGHLEHTGHLWRFKDFAGKVGDSDLAGSFALDVGGARPLVDADLVSKRLDYEDLGGLVGLPANEPTSARSVPQNREAAKRAASARVLPARPYRVDKFRIVDANVRFKGKRFLASNLPLDDMKATLELRDGVLVLRPLDFGVAGGHVTSTLTLDARDEIIRTEGDVTMRNVELSQVAPEIKPPRGSAGKVGGRARFTARGNSIAEMLATSNGDIALISRGGDASKLAVVLTNLDLARAGQLLLRGDTSSPIRCIVADFAARDGTMFARRLVIDTEVEKVVGDGSVDFARERYDLTLNAESKRPSILALRGPIVVEGSFKAPSVHPAAGPIAARVGAAVALGALTPVAALLPLIDMGGHPDADCAALIEEAKENVDLRAPARKSAAAQSR